MKINKIKLIFMCMCIIAIMLFLPTKVKAVLQSSGGEGAKKNLATWIKQIRQMEQTGGALGLQETFNDDLTSSSNSNNLDCHMEKNTEFGAMAILSASSYGKPDKINNGETTTGNKSGIYIRLNGESVSAGNINYLSSSAATGQKINAKYMDNYDSVNDSVTYNKKNGDAITETKNWHLTSSRAIWISSVHNNLLRSESYGLFSYYGMNTSANGAYYDVPWSSRAVIVVGQGL